MTNDELMRTIFSRFQNVNLLALIGDLEKEQVCSNSWIMKSLRWTDERYMCPVAHGVNVFGCRCPEGVAAKELGVDKVSVINEFVNRWDHAQILWKELLLVCRSIFAERLADADAVQEVLSREVVGVRTVEIVPAESWSDQPLVYEEAK